MVLSLSSYMLHLLFYYVLSILALIILVQLALFCASIRRDSVSLLRFPFLSHVQVFSYEMLLISRLKRPTSCFSSHFCFPVIVIRLVPVSSVLFLVAVIRLPPRFCIWSLYCISRCIDASTLSSMMASHLPPSLPNIHSLSTSSMECNALCRVISFLVL